MSALAGKRILVVEDEYLVAATAADALSDLGAVIVGPAATVAIATDLARNEAIDVAMLDMNVNGERVDAVAGILKKRNIPFIFATGYGAEAKSEAGGAPLIDKPYTDDQLAEVLTRALSARN